MLRNGKRGIHCIGSSATIKNNIITDNQEAGIWCSHSSSLIKNNAISGNVGGGISCYEGSYTIQSNIISGNEAEGIMCYDSSLTIQNNIISNNVGIYSVSGIRSLTSSLIVQNNTIVGNGYCGVSCYDNSSLDILNNIITSNGYYGIYAFNSNPNISYNDVWDNTHGNYYGDAYPGIGDISVDPEFFNPLDSDFHLVESSPCIDAGGLDITGLPDTDFEGDPRVFPGDGKGVILVGSPPQPAIVDMGADEYCLLKRNKIAF